MGRTNKEDPRRNKMSKKHKAVAELENEVVENEVVEEAPARVVAVQKERSSEDDVIYARAIRVGFYEHVRRYPVGHDHPRAGEVFAIRPQSGAHKTGGSGAMIPIHLTPRMQFSKGWMEEVEPDLGKQLVSRQIGIVHKPAIIKKPLGNQSVI